MSYNIRVPDMLSDDEGSVMGIDMLMNPKKVHSPRQDMDSGSIRSFKADIPRVVNIGDDDDDDDFSGIEVISTKSEERGSGGFQSQAPPKKVALSDISSESDWNAKPAMNGEDILNAKRELLYQFARLEKRGVQVPKKFNLSSSLEEMKMEYERLKRDIEVEASVRFQRRMLMACTTGIEFLNTRFDPLDIKLEGWSENLQENINDYDDIFEELYEKYKGKSKFAPELRLMFMVGGSAVWFHISNSMIKTSLPGLDQVFKQNPELRRQFAEATMNTMAQQQPTQEHGGGGGGMGAFGGLMNMFGGFGGGGSTPAMSQPAPAQRPSMKGPSNVDDLLNELKEDRFNQNDQTDVLEMFSNASGSVTDDDASINGLLLNKKKRSGRQRRTMNI